MRFAPGALLMAPLFWRWGWLDLEVPSLLQVLGIVAVVAGLLLAFGAARLLLPRHQPTTH